MRIVNAGLVLLFLGLGQLNAAQYFVDYLTGSDSNPGTHPKIPWQHCPGDPAATGIVAGSSL
jgi:hypothetical protein